MAAGFNHSLHDGRSTGWPVCLYCLLLLNGISHKDITRLQRIQNRCARLIFKKPKRTHSSPLLKELHWLPVAQRIQFRTLVHTFKSLNNLSPHYISSLLHVRKPPAYSLRSSTVTCLHVPKTRTLTGDRAFSSSAPRLWNNLPAMIRGATTTDSFKKSLKCHLFPISWFPFSLALAFFPPVFPLALCILLVKRRFINVLVCMYVCMYVCLFSHSETSYGSKFKMAPIYGNIFV